MVLKNSNSVRRIRIAARQSDLARLQAWDVGSRLVEKFPGLEIEYSFRASLGDQNASDPLWKMPEKGVFTEDFVKDLQEHKVDLVVHSWKDLPIGDRNGTQIVGTLARADMRDVILVRRDRWEAVKSGANASTFTILTSSPRREFNLATTMSWLLPFPASKIEFRFKPVRGNILTRVKKLFDVDDAVSGDAIIVAKAALDRLLGFDRSKRFSRMPDSRLKLMNSPPRLSTSF